MRDVHLDVAKKNQNASFLVPVSVGGFTKSASYVCLDNYVSLYILDS